MTDHRVSRDVIGALVNLRHEGNLGVHESVGNEHAVHLGDGHLRV